MMIAFFLIVKTALLTEEASVAAAAIESAHTEIYYFYRYFIRRLPVFFYTFIIEPCACFQGFLYENLQHMVTLINW